MAQKLITKAIANKIQNHPYGSQDGKNGDAEVLARIFGGAATFYILEGYHQNGEEWDGHTVYGLVNIGYGFEYGPFDLNDLARGYNYMGMRLPYERDRWADRKLADCARSYGEKMPYAKVAA